MWVPMTSPGFCRRECGTDQQLKFIYFLMRQTWTPCSDIVGSEQWWWCGNETWWETHSRLSWSSADDLNNISAWGDIWEVWLPLLQLLRKAEERTDEKNRPSMRICTKCLQHTGLNFIQFGGMVRWDSFWILTCKALLRLTHLSLQLETLKL